MTRTPDILSNNLILERQNLVLSVTVEGIQKFITIV